MCELDPDAVRRVTATERRDDGIARAVDHADRVSHAWSVLAYQTLIEYLNFTHNVVGDDLAFLAEDFTGYALARHVPKPPDNRAFGAIIQRAARAGLIVKAGYREDRYCSPKTLWRRV